MALSNTAEAVYSANAALGVPDGIVHRRKNSDQLPLWIEPYQHADIVAGPFIINDRCKTVFVEGKQYQLSPKEYVLLKRLVMEQGSVVSSEEIIAELWPPNSTASASDVKQYVHLLRQRIEQNPKKPRWIENVRGFGYRLAVETETATVTKTVT